jgi:hypothetical protein
VFQTGKFKRASTVYRRNIGGWTSSQFPPTNPDWDSFGSSRRVIAGLHDSPQSHGLSVEFSKVAGFKTLDEGHVDVWPTVQRLDHTLVDYEYDYFPRGRANWRSWFSIQSLIAVHLSLTSCVRGKYPEIDYSC